MIWPISAIRDKYLIVFNQQEFEMKWIFNSEIGALANDGFV